MNTRTVILEKNARYTAINKALNRISLPLEPWLAAQAGEVMFSTVRKPESLSAPLAGKNEGGEA